MKNTMVLFLGFCLLFGCQTKVNKEIENKMKALLKNQAFFELRELYATSKSEISEQLSLEVQAHLLNTFNKNVASNLQIQKLLDTYDSALSDSLKAEMELVKADNYLKLFDYKNATIANQKVMHAYKNHVDSVTLAEAQNMNSIYEPLKNIKPQRVIISSDNSIPIKRDVVGLMNVEVSLKGKNYDFIFDTGAGMPVIKRGFAEELGLQMLETSIDVKSATGKVLQSSLALIDTLTMANIMVLNSVFLVMEDEMLEFPQINFFPKAAIGFPIMEEFKEFSITRSDTLLVPKNTTTSTLANMRLNGLSPNVYLFNGSDTLELAFDTGATRTHYTTKYYDKYKAQLESGATSDSVRTSSAGGAKMHASYLLDSTVLYIGAQKAVLHNIHVHTDYNDTFSDVYGNLGQDLIKQFDKMTLNFEDMYLKFE